MGRLEGKVALITGGSSGIGLATARAFLAEGAARVYVTGRRQTELDSATRSLGTRAVGLRGDVTIPGDLERLCERIKTESGRLDIVFANAGIAAPSPLGTITEAHLDTLLGTNVKGVVWTVQTALPLMGPGSSIILSSSVVGTKGFADWSIYSATKAAVRSFARTWAADLKGKNIRVNAISPGVIETPGWTASNLPKEQVAGFFDFAASVTPLGRVGRDQEVAHVAVFLASEASSFVSGSEIFIDGGMAQV